MKGRHSEDEHEHENSCAGKQDFEGKSDGVNSMAREEKPMNHMFLFFAISVIFCSNLLFVSESVKICVNRWFSSTVSGFWFLVSPGSERRKDT